MAFTKDELIARGHHAQQLLSDPILSEAFEMVESEVMRLWRTSDAGATGDRERLWLSMTLLEGVKRSIFNVAQTGKKVEADIATLLKPVDAINPPLS